MTLDRKTLEAAADMPTRIWARRDAQQVEPGEVTGKWVDHGPGEPDEFCYILALSDTPPEPVTDRDVSGLIFKDGSATSRVAAIAHQQLPPPPEPVSVQEAARVLLDAANSGLDLFPVDGDNELEGLAIKWSGNRGDGVIQLEIAEEFMRESLRYLSIKEVQDDL